MSTGTRDQQFKVLLSEEEHKALKRLAQQDGVTASDYIRLIIRRDSGLPVPPAILEQRRAAVRAAMKKQPK